MSKSELENLIDVMKTQVVQISLRWKTYCQLFMSGSAKVELLNKSASNVFGLVQRLMLDDTIMSVSKLTDPAISGRYQNASVHNLIEKASAYLSATTRDEVNALVKNLMDHVKNARIHRDKFLAHSDLTLAASALPQVGYGDLESAMSSLQEILAKVAFAACGCSIRTPIDVIIPFGTGGDALLRILECGHSEGVHSSART
jgi:hypothetical protein